MDRFTFANSLIDVFTSIQAILASTGWDTHGIACRCREWDTLVCGFEKRSALHPQHVSPLVLDFPFAAQWFDCSKPQDPFSDSGRVRPHVFTDNSTFWPQSLDLYQNVSIWRWNFEIKSIIAIIYLMGVTSRPYRARFVIDIETWHAFGLLMQQRSWFNPDM